MKSNTKKALVSMTLLFIVAFSLCPLTSPVTARSSDPGQTTVNNFVSMDAMPNLTERSADYTIVSLDSVLGKEVLMGFTYHQTVTQDWGANYAVYRWHAHAQVDFDFGLRYPVGITLEYPDLMTVEHDHELRAKLTPLDWPNYDEFLLKAHVWAWYKSEYWFFGWHTDDYESYDEHYDYSLSFPTPFGPEMSFPLGSLGITLFDSEGLTLNLTIEPQLGSDKITAQVTASGDATGNQTITFTAPEQWVPFTVHADDYGPTDFAEITLSDFRYYFSLFNLIGKLYFDFHGSIEEWIGDFTITVYTLDLSYLTEGAYMPLHEGTDPTMRISIFVQNFGLDLLVSPGTVDIEPGYWGTYNVTVTNTGNVPDTFHMRARLPLFWRYKFSELKVSMNPGESRSLQVSVKPWRHFSTSPGDYTINVIGESEGAKIWDLVRTGSDHAIVHVLPFYEVELSIDPESSIVKPGDTASYTVKVTNLGNVIDSFVLTLECFDFGNFYLAVPGFIQPGWITIDKNPIGLLGNPIGPIGPGDYDIANLVISVPSDWAGMMDATYKFDVTATSFGDMTHTSPMRVRVRASDTYSAELTVEATEESMLRYLWLILLAQLF